MTKMLRQNGMSLIELIATLAISTILLLVGVPTFRNYLDNQELKTISYQLMSALRTARSEAVNRNATVSLATLDMEDDEDDENWSFGWRILDASGNELRNYALDSRRWQIQNTSTVKIEFGSSGRAGLGENTTFELCTLRSAEGVAKRRIRVVSGAPMLSLASTCVGS